MYTYKKRRLPRIFTIPASTAIAMLFVFVIQFATINLADASTSIEQPKYDEHPQLYAIQANDEHEHETVLVWVIESAALTAPAEPETEPPTYTEPATTAEIIVSTTESIPLATIFKHETTELHIPEYSTEITTVSEHDKEPFKKSVPASVPVYIPASVTDLGGEYVFLAEFKLTAYCLCAICCEIWSAEHPSRQGTDFVQKTATGTTPTVGRTIAVDPKVIPYGTSVYIEGIGLFVAEDTGAAMRRNDFLIDVLQPDHDSTWVFGVQRANVWIKK